MRLLEIQLRAWRGLDQTLAGLSPRLNLILGPNESGKSRIFQALNFALFEPARGTGQRKLALQGWSSTDSPFVRIVFALEGVEYELQKQFLKGASVQLAGGGRTLRGEDAEDTLRELLGARANGARGAEATNLGIWPLLMVAQGSSRRMIQDDLNEGGRGRLHERLSQEIGVAATSSAGQKVMALAEQEYGRYFTPTGLEGKSLRDARSEARTAEAMLAQTTAALAHREQTATALAQNQQDLGELEARRARAKNNADAARDRSEAAQAAGRLMATAQGAVNTAVQRAASAKEALGIRQEADAAIERLSGDLQRLEPDFAQRARLDNELERGLQAAEKQFGDATRRANESRAAVDELQRQRRHDDLSATARELSARIDIAKQNERSIAAARGQLASLPAIDEPGLMRLKMLDQSARAAAARLQGAAVSVVVSLRQDAVVEGVRHAAGETLQFHLLENRRISLGDLADVDIQPGGGELERLRSMAAAADEELKAALQAAGVADVDEASRMRAQRARWEQQITELGTKAKPPVGKSLSQMREELSACRAELERLGAPGVFTLDEVVLRAELGSAEAALIQATIERDAATAAFAVFKTETEGLRVRIETVRDEHRRLAALYADRPIAEQLEVALDEAVTDRERCTVALADAKRQFLDLGGTEIQSEARGLASEADGLVTRVRALRSSVDQLQGELRSLMLAGHYESQEEAGARLEQAQNDLRRLERQSAAARRLWEVLSSERSRVVEKLIAPVVARVQPYLQDLFPGSVLDAGERLDVLGLKSADLSEPISELSGGAQEQISLLTRIGIAEVLAADGTLPLVLDDALINTDPERIRRIQRLLFRAADKLQIILFSCHDVLFDELGAEFVHQLPRRRH
jgi:DNA repair exonuclease SbcCD ATPase subunit